MDQKLKANLNGCNSVGRAVTSITERCRSNPVKFNFISTVLKRQKYKKEAGN